MSSENQDRFRQTWKVQELSGKPAQAWLVIRRTVATLLAIGLIAFFGLWIFRLFWVQKAYLAYWTTSTYQPMSAGPVKYAYNDFKAIETLKGEFLAGNDLVDPAAEKLTKELLEKKLQALSGLGLRSKDTCVVFLTAHGGVRNKEAYLLCEPGDRKSELPLADVLTALKNVTAGTKLLVLDTGRDELAPEVGASSDNTFPELLAKAVKESGDPSLWVLTANSSLERSHVSPELNRSVFGYMVSQGLRGAADVDQDHEIQLGELYNYVQKAVAARVKAATTSGESQTANGESQTPQLFHHDPEMLKPDRVAAQKLIHIGANSAEPEPAAEPAAEHEADHEGEGGGIGGWLATATKDIKEQISPANELEIAKHIAGIHEGHEDGSHETHAGGPAEEHSAHGEAEKKDETAHETTPAKIDSAAAARKKVADAWQDVAKLEASANQSSPVVLAPPHWRELLDQLLWCDQVCASGVPPAAKASWKEIDKELKGIRKSLEVFGDYRLPPPLNVPTAKQVSFALVDRLAAGDPKNALAKPFTEFLTAYDGLLFKEPAASFSEKLSTLLAGQKSDLGLANYYEFQLIGLSKDPEVSSGALQLVLRARREGETVATAQLCGEGWQRDTIEAADRLRSEGEREMLDRTNPDWEKLAMERLAAAVTGYETAYRNLEVVRSTIQYRNNNLLRAPDLVRRACLNGGDPKEIAAVEKVLSSLDALDKALANPAGDSIDSLNQLRTQLQTANTALDQETDPADNAWRMANLLVTTIPLPDVRTKLGDELAATEKKQMASFKIPESDSEAVQSLAPSEAQWTRATDEFELQIALARLAGCDEAALGALSKSLKGATSERVVKLNEARSQLAEMFDGLNVSIAANANAAQLRSALPQWLLLGAQHRDRLDPKNSLAARLDRANWHDLLAWNSERFRRAADDAPLSEDPLLHSVSETFRGLANAIADQPTIAEHDQPMLSIDLPKEVSLVAAEEAPLTFRVKSTADDEKPIWLVAQYYGDVISGAAPIHRQQELVSALARPNLGEKASRYPLRPDALGLKESDRLPGHGTRDYTLKIKRPPSSDAGGTAKLIVKAVSGETFVRREMNVKLPGRESLDITTNLPPDFWTPGTHSLHPLPNRTRKFTFDVVNSAKVAKNLDVSIWAPTSIPSEEKLAAIPTSAVSTSSANQLLEPYGLLPIGIEFPVSLPASGAPVRIQLPADPSKGKPPANLLLKDTADPATFPGIPLNYGLIFRLADKKNDQVTIRRIEITPQRVHGYLEAVAHYDKGKERVEIDVKATKPAVIPDDGLKISAKISGASDQGENSLTDTLKRSSNEAKLFTELVAGTDDITAYVNVDDYPRAFVFKFPRSIGADVPILPRTDLGEVRIVSPEPGFPFAPVNGITTVKVKAEVDAPEGSFGYKDRTSIVELGIDQDQDRELKGDPVQIRRSDRQVTITAKSLSPDGSLELDTRVRDFEVDITTGLTNKKVSLIGRILLDGKTSYWSDLAHPVEVILDGAPPVIHADFPPQPGLLPSDNLREIPQVISGEDLIVHMFMYPDDEKAELSGVQEVQAVFAMETAKGAETKSPEIGLPDGKGGWTATLSTKKIGLGKQSVRITATDKVTNKSTPFQRPVEIVLKPTAAGQVPANNKTPDVANEVTGKVQFGDAGVQSTVELIAAAGPPIKPMTTDESGAFKFSKVPPGKYTLKAVTKEALQNYHLKAEKEIDVPALPKPVTPTTLKVKWTGK